MSIVVYWLSQGQPSVQVFADDQLLAALAFAEARRKDRDETGLALNQHVVISSELGDHVGAHHVLYTGGRADAAHPLR